MANAVQPANGWPLGTTEYVGTINSNVLSPYTVATIPAGNVWTILGTRFFSDDPTCTMSGATYATITVSGSQIDIINGTAYVGFSPHMFEYNGGGFGAPIDLNLHCTGAIGANTVWYDIIVYPGGLPALDTLQVNCTSGCSGASSVMSTSTIDFASNSFVETCESSVSVNGTTVKQCYSSATAFNEILLATVLFFALGFMMIRFVTTTFKRRM